MIPDNFFNYLTEIKNSNVVEYFSSYFFATKLSKNVTMYNRAYIFQSQASVAVYSFNGATVTLSGNEKCVGDAYVSKVSNQIGVDIFS